MPEPPRPYDVVAAAADDRRGPTAVALGVLRRGSPPSVLTAGDARPGTRFDLASVSKVVTTLAVMRLRAAGALDLDAPVRTLLPAFRGGAKDEVTVRALLLH